MYYAHNHLGNSDLYGYLQHYPIEQLIYDLINTEQLDPWDINIVVLTDKFLERIEKMEETDFFISSKVLLAAALLLRITSEVLLNTNLKSIDDLLFGKKEQKLLYSYFWADIWILSLLWIIIFNRQNIKTKRL